MRITRGHYNRKLLAFGAMAFLAIALISTGFAAWIMSSGAETGFEDGNLTVGEITESDLKFTDYEIIAGDTKLLFEPAQGDVTGDIKGNGSDYENLTFTLKTTTVFSACSPPAPMPRASRATARPSSTVWTGMRRWTAASSGSAKPLTRPTPSWRTPRASATASGCC